MPIEGTIPPLPVFRIMSVGEKSAEPVGTSIDPSQGQCVAEPSYFPPDPKSTAQTYDLSAQPQSIVPPVLQEYPPELLMAMDHVSFAIDNVETTSGPGWERPAVPNEQILKIIKDYRAQAAAMPDEEIRLREEAARLELTGTSDDNRKAMKLRQKADACPYMAETLTYEANRLEALINQGRDIPGGLLDVQLGGREAYVVPDLHGNTEGFQKFLNTPLAGGKTLLQKITANEAVLVIVGDSPHTVTEPLFAMSSSEDIVADILRLENRFPDNVFYTEGNHDAVYGGGEHGFSKGGINQGLFFRDALIDHKGIGYARSLQAFIDGTPVIVRFMNGDEAVAVAGHTPVAIGGITPEEAVMAKFDPQLRFELTWNTPNDPERHPYYAEDLEFMRQKIGSPQTVFLSGHTDEGFSAWQPKDMPGHAIGQATAPYNDNLVMFKVTSDAVEVVNVTGHSDLTGINFREQLAPPPSNDYVSFMPEELPVSMAEIPETKAATVMSESIFDSNLKFLNSHELKVFAGQESIGGNAGAGHLAVNVWADPATGKIEYCSNGGSNMTFRMTSGRIIDKVIIKVAGLESFADSFQRMAIEHNDNLVTKNLAQYSDYMRQVPSMRTFFENMIALDSEVAARTPKVVVGKTLFAPGSVPTPPAAEHGMVPVQFEDVTIDMTRTPAPSLGVIPESLASASFNVLGGGMAVVGGEMLGEIRGEPLSAGEEGVFGLGTFYGLAAWSEAAAAGGIQCVDWTAFNYNFGMSSPVAVVAAMPAFAGASVVVGDYLDPTSFEGKLAVTTVGGVGLAGALSAELPAAMVVGSYTTGASFMSGAAITELGIPAAAAGAATPVAVASAGFVGGYAAGKYIIDPVGGAAIYTVAQPTAYSDGTLSGWIAEDEWNAATAVGTLVAGPVAGAGIYGLGRLIDYLSSDDDQ